MLIDCHNHLGADLFFYLNGYYPYAQDLPALVTEGSRHGVDRWVAFPMVANLTFDIPSMRQGKLVRGGLETVPYAFENERMLREIYELHPNHGKRILPFMILDPLHEPRAQVEFLRRIKKEFPYYGLKIQATMIQTEVSALLREGRVFLEFAEEFDLPFIIHSSVAADDLWSQAKDILAVAEATPGVRFCLAHSCRFDRECLDRVAELPNTWFDCSAHRIHCDSAVANLPFVAAPDRRLKADYRDPSAVLNTMAELYPKKLIWGSDSPFESYVAKLDGNVVSLVSTYEKEVECINALPEGLRRLAGCDNLLSLLRLKDEHVLAGV